MPAARTELFSRHQAGGVFTIASVREHPGAIFFVGSAVTGATDGAGYGDNPDRPFATIDYAVGQCTANAGDVVYVLPGHAETVATANALDLDVAGIKVLGLGQRGARPTITVNGLVGACVRINANGVWLENVVILGGLDNITNVVTINAKTDITLRNIEYRDLVGQCANFLLTVDGTDRLAIDGLTYIGAAGGGTVAAIQLDGSDDCEIKNFDIYGNFSNAGIELITTASNRVSIHDGKVWTENAADLCIKDTVTASTGYAGPNLYLMLQDNAANITEAITAATFQQMPPIYVCNLAGEIAMAINTTASTDA